ncbi:hypothetical protein RUND412_006327 [Rhizina undulata]
MAPPIIILGASLSGIPLAHHLLNTLPSQKIVLVNPSTHYYYNMAAPRAIIGPSALGKGQASLNIPIADGFKKYPASRFEFIQGKATGVLSGENIVVVQTFTDDTVHLAQESRLEYSQLVVATGANAIDGGVFKQTATGTLKELKIQLAGMAAAIEAASTILLSGAGSTGVETAGEIASKYPAKKVILVASGSQVLPMVREDVGRVARGLLEKLGVEIRWNAKVTEERKNSGGSEIVLSTGETINVNVFIPTHGISPNSSFLPKEWLDAGSYLVTDEFLRVPKTRNVWALGDVTAWGNRKATTIDAQLFILAGNLRKVLDGKDASEFEAYKHSDELIMVVPVGPRFGMGTGIFGGWRMWGWLVWLFKGRTYGVEKGRSLVEGKGTIMGKKL